MYQMLFAFNMVPHDDFCSTLMFDHNSGNIDSIFSSNDMRSISCSILVATKN